MSDPAVGEDAPVVIVRPATRRWGFMEDGVFVPVPKGPLIQACLEPPCVISVRGAPRCIVEEPDST